jgi:hypothetical protein
VPCMPGLRKPSRQSGDLGSSVVPTWRANRIELRGIKSHQPDYRRIAQADDVRRRQQ